MSYDGVAVSTTTIRGADGTLTVSKTAESARSSLRLRREALVLEALQHPSLPCLLACEEHPRGITLQLTHCGTAIVDLDNLGAVRLADLLVALCSTVADLHDVGAAHGRIDPSHVLVGADGRVSICSLAQARLPGESDGPLASDDVAAIGRVIQALFSSVDAEPTASAASRREDSPRWLCRGMLNLADLAQHDDPQARPSARELAASVAALVEEATDSRPTRIRSAAREAPLAVGLCVAVLALGSAWWWSSQDPPPTGPEDASAADPLEASSSTDPAGSPSMAGPLHESNPSTGPSTAMIEGGIVETPQGVFRIGEETDLVAIGDWDCDGAPTPALLRPGTGEVFVFAEWAAPSLDLEVGAVGIYPGATGIAAEQRTSAPCHSIELRDSAGMTLAAEVEHGG